MYSRDYNLYCEHSIPSVSSSSRFQIGLEISSPDRLCGPLRLLTQGSKTSFFPCSLISPADNLRPRDFPRSCGKNRKGLEDKKWF
jgi:hypothetical protein